MFQFPSPPSVCETCRSLSFSFESFITPTLSLLFNFHFIINNKQLKTTRYSIDNKQLNPTRSHGHRYIGSGSCNKPLALVLLLQNKQPQPVSESTVILMYLRVYDSRHNSGNPAPSPFPRSSLTHSHNIHSPTLPTPTLLTKVHYLLYIYLDRLIWLLSQLSESSLLDWFLEVSLIVIIKGKSPQLERDQQEWHTHSLTETYTHLPLCHWHTLVIISCHWHPPVYISWLPWPSLPTINNNW